MKQEDFNEQVWEEYQKLKSEVKSLVIGLLTVPVVLLVISGLIWLITEGIYQFIGG